MRKYIMRTLVALAIILAGTMNLRGQEHPTGDQPPEHPTAGQQAGPVITIADLEKAINRQITEKTQAEGGYFHVYDPVLHKTWSAKLVRIHTDKLTQLNKDTYFACTDFRADDGTMLDVDFYMKDKDGNLTFSDTAIHKVNGKPRFTYEKQNGFWKRVNVGS